VFMQYSVFPTGTESRANGTVRYPARDTSQRANPILIDGRIFIKDCPKPKKEQKVGAGDSDGD
jgi:hypothetical protein